jgi:sugar transferase (PEP-CTERM/EpsH1 system associated)
VAELLVVCSRTPYPLVGGAKVRLYNTARILAEDHDVDLLIVDEAPIEKTRIDPLSEMFRSVKLFTYPSYSFYLNTLRGVLSRTPLQSHYFQFDEVYDWVDRHVRDYDLVYCNHVRTTEYVREYDVRKVADLVDAISRNYIERRADVAWPQRLLYTVESDRLADYERTVAREFDRTLITTAADRRHIVNPLPNSIGDTVRVVPNGVRADLIDRDPAIGSVNSDRLVFLGKMDYFPNEDAVNYFAEDVFPQIRAVHSDAEFLIVGASPSNQVSKLEVTPGVTVTGYVEDPRTYLTSAAVVVAPLRHGAGLQNKILEAMALARPVVTTSLGAEGIDAEDGTHLFVADDSENFAERVVDLLDHPNRRVEIGTAARRLVKNTYRWESIARTLKSTVQEVLDESDPGLVVNDDSWG